MGMSTIPTDLSKVEKGEIDKEILRAGMIAELDAVSFYEQMAALTSNNDIKKILLDIAKEEKTHIAEFETMLLRLDKEQVEEYICIEESFILELKNKLEYFYSENNRDDEFYEIEDQYEDLEKAIENFWEDYED